MGEKAERWRLGGESGEAGMIASEDEDSPSPNKKPV